MTDIRTIKKYAGLAKQKRDLEFQLKQVNAKMAELQDGVIAYMERQGLDRTTVEGVTIYVRRELWAGREGDAGHEEAATALEVSGLGEYAAPRVNTQSLSAFVREVEGDNTGEAGEAFFRKFPNLKGIIKISEVFKVGTRTSS